MSRLRYIRTLQNQSYDPAAAGTRVSIAHGLTDNIGRPLTPNIVIATPRIADADGAIATPIIIHVVSIDATDVVVRCNVDAITFDLTVGYSSDFATAEA